jgi:hypothetical protein
LRKLKEVAKEEQRNKGTEEQRNKGTKEQNNRTKTLVADGGKNRGTATEQPVWRSLFLFPIKSRRSIFYYIYLIIIITANIIRIHPHFSFTFTLLF